MSGPGDTLTLVIPGLLGPFPDDISGVNIPELPSLQRILSRSRRSRTPSPAAEYEQLLFSLFGYHYTLSKELPVASLRRLADGLEVDEECYICSDPVQLVADQDQVYLTASDELAVTTDEAKALADAFNSLYTEEGWVIDFSHPQRWYLSLGESPELLSRSPTQAMGYAIKPWLPQGKDALRWHAVMNEIQMLFHSQDVNQLRESRGERLISGLWLWGSGRLPEKVRVSYDRVWSDELLATGLALHNSVESEELPEGLAEALSVSNGLVVLDTLHQAVATGNMELWKHRLRELEEMWFEPLLHVIKSRQLGCLELYPVNGHAYRVNAKSLKRWWRRNRALDYYF